MGARRFLRAGLVVLFFATAAAAQDPPPDPAADSGDARSVGLRDTLEKAARTNPDLINAALNALAPNDLRAFLAATNLRFKYFNDISAGDDNGLGFEYSLDKSLISSPLGDQERNPLGLSLNFKARGNVAFDQDINPTDFLDTSVQVHLFQTIGGVKEDWSLVDADDLQQAALLAAEDDEKNWPVFARKLAKALDTQFFWDLTGHATFESNQDFSSKQLAYGLLLGGSIGAWDPESPWAKFNPFDWPFRVLRILVGTPEDKFQSGRSWPVLLLGLDGVDPTDNEARLAVDNDEDLFPRFRTEVAFRTHVADVMQNGIWFSTSYRLYQEIGASAQIRQADLDQHSYVVAMLELPFGINVSYASGKLPLDRKNDDVFELGYTVRIPPALLGDG